MKRRMRTVGRRSAVRGMSTLELARELARRLDNDDEAQLAGYVLGWDIGDCVDQFRTAVRIGHEMHEEGAYLPERERGERTPEDEAAAERAFGERPYHCDGDSCRRAAGSASAVCNCCCGICSMTRASHAKAKEEPKRESSRELLQRRHCCSTLRSCNSGNVFERAPCSCGCELCAPTNLAYQPPSIPTEPEDLIRPVAGGLPAHVRFHADGTEAGAVTFCVVCRLGEPSGGTAIVCPGCTSTYQERRNLRAYLANHRTVELKTD
jgi:hypothetical protein